MLILPSKTGEVWSSGLGSLLNSCQRGAFVPQSFQCRAKEEEKRSASQPVGFVTLCPRRQGHVRKHHLKSAGRTLVWTQEHSRKAALRVPAREFMINFAGISCAMSNGDWPAQEKPGDVYQTKLLYLAALSKAAVQNRQIEANFWTDSMHTFILGFPPAPSLLKWKNMSWHAQCL